MLAPLPPGSMQAWLTDLRKVALLTFVWIAIQYSGIFSLLQNLRSLLAIVLLAVILLVQGAFPWFLYELSRHPEPLLFPRRQRSLAQAGLVMFILATLMNTPVLLRPFEVLWDQPRSFGRLIDIGSATLPIVLTAIPFLLLAAFIRACEAAPGLEGRPGKRLRIAALAALIAGALSFTFALIRVADVALIYSRELSLPIRFLQEPPSLISLMLAPLRVLFATATLLIPPYQVYKLAKLSPDPEPLLARDADSEDQEQTASAQIELPPADAT